MAERSVLNSVCEVDEAVVVAAAGDEDADGDDDDDDDCAGPPLSTITKYIN